MRRVSALCPAASSCRYRWFKPGGNSRWRPGGCVNIHTVKIRVPAVVQTRGESNVSRLDEARHAVVADTVQEVSTRRRAVLLCSSSRASLSYSPTGQPRGLKPELQLHSPPSQGVLSSVACAWFGLLPKGCRSRVRSQCRTLTSHVRHRAPRVASRIALCTRPPTTHSRGASGHTSWI